MLTAAQLRAGMAIRYEGESYRVLGAEYHPGQGKMGGVSHARLRNLQTGTLWEHSFRGDVRLETLTVEKKPFEFVYKDGEDYVFMDVNSFEQIAVGASVVGENAAFLVPQMSVAIEFIDEDPVAVAFPDVVEATVVETDPPIHGSDNVWKTAKLESGVEVMAPAFVKTGDAIRVDVATRRYMDRVKAAGR